MGPLGKFLLALGNMVRTGGIKKIEDAFNMAKQEFGEVTPLLKKQIERIFANKKQAPGIKNKKEGEVIEASFKPGRDKKGNVVEESPSQKARREEAWVILENAFEMREKILEFLNK